MKKGDLVRVELSGPDGYLVRCFHATFEEYDEEGHVVVLDQDGQDYTVSEGDVTPC